MNISFKLKELNCKTKHLLQRSGGVSSTRGYLHRGAFRHLKNAAGELDAINKSLDTLLGMRVRRTRIVLYGSETWDDSPGYDWQGATFEGFMISSIQTQLQLLINKPKRIDKLILRRLPQLAEQAMRAYESYQRFVELATANPPNHHSGEYCDWEGDTKYMEELQELLSSFSVKIADAVQGNGLSNKSDVRQPTSLHNQNDAGAWGGSARANVTGPNVSQRGADIRAPGGRASQPIIGSGNVTVNIGRGAKVDEIIINHEFSPSAIGGNGGDIESNMSMDVTSYQKVQASADAVSFIENRLKQWGAVAKINQLIKAAKNGPDASRVSQLEFLFASKTGGNYSKKHETFESAAKEFSRGDRSQLPSRAFEIMKEVLMIGYDSLPVREQGKLK